MGPIEYALIGGVVLYVLTAYLVKTRELAIMVREPMAKELHRILSDAKAPQELKDHAVTVFALAINPRFPLYALLFAPFSKRLTKSKRLATEHQQVLDGMIREHFFRVNLIAAPHWWALIVVLFFVVILISAVLSLGRVGLRPIKAIEDAILHPGCLRKGGPGCYV